MNDYQVHAISLPLANEQDIIMYVSALTTTF